MIQGRTDTYFTVEEFAEMIGRSPKTVTNWAAQGKLRFVYLCGVPLVSLALVEQQIDGHQVVGAEADQVAIRMMNKEPMTKPPMARTSR
jgi:hypothetical protein